MLSKKKIPVQEKLKLKKKSYKASHEKEICQQIAKKKTKQNKNSMHKQGYKTKQDVAYSIIEFKG